MDVNDLFKKINPVDNRSKQTSQFITRLLFSAPTVHLMHLKTKSYAAHMALGDFYEKMPGLVDAFAESYQGVYGVIEEHQEPPPHVINYNDPLGFIESLRGFVNMQRTSLPQNSELMNAVDEIVTLINSTIYKLKNLH